MSRKIARAPQAKRSDLLLILLALGVLVLAVFLPTLHSQFVYDALAEIGMWDWLHNPHNILTAVSFRLMSLDVVDFNRPVAVAWLMYNSMLWGRDPFGYHLDSVLLHITVTCLVFVLIRHLLDQGAPHRDPARRNSAAFFATLLFALHPLVTEAVCEPANCKDLLATLFGLAALLVATRHRPGFGPGDPARMLLCPLLCLLSIGSKEVGVAFPAVLLAYWFLFRRREPPGFWLAVIGAGAAVDILFLIARFHLEHHPSIIFLIPPAYPGGTLFYTQACIQPRIFALYLFNLFCPLYLCADYGPYSVRYLPLWLSVLLDLLAVAGLAWCSRRDRRAFFASVFLVATLLPVSNLVPIFRAAADRFLYAPLIGVMILAALALDSPGLAGNRLRRRIGSAVVVLVLALMLPVTLQREHTWSSEIPLWQDTLARNPTSFAAWVGLPEALLRAGRYAEARKQSETALSMGHKDWPWVWFDYALELEKLGDHAGAERAAQRAIELKPDITDAAKMSGTLQVQAPMVEQFDRIAARLPAAR
jgi:protein O-mannosyl-transferase